MNKILNIFFIITTVVILLIIFLHSDFQGGQKSELENRYLAKMPSIKELSADSFEKWINDNIGYRNSIMKLKAYIEFHLFNKTISYKVVIGKDGFLFYTENQNLNIALNKYKYTAAEYNNLAKELNKLQNIIEKRNIQFIYTIAPSKVSIYPEKIRGYNLDVIDTPADIIEKYLPDSFNYINLKQVLLKYKNKENIDKLYWKTDTHWTYYGAYLGYLAVIDYINQNNMYTNKIEPVDVHFTDIFLLGGLSRMAGGESIVAKEFGKQSQINNTTFYQETLDKTLLELQNEKKGGRIASYTNPKSSNELNVLCICDSMFGLWNVPELFAQTFKNYTFVWGVNLTDELIERVKPDIIIYEIGERMLNFLVYPMIHRFIVAENNAYKYSAKNLDKEEMIENDIHYHFDNKNIKNNIYVLSGWAYIKDKKKTGQVYIGIKDKSGKETYYITEQLERPDIVKYFNNADLLESGFKIKIENKEECKLSSLIVEYENKYYKTNIE